MVIISVRGRSCFALLETLCARRGITEFCNMAACKWPRANFQVRHPRCVEYKLKYNIIYKIYIIQSDTILYFMKLYWIIIPATCFGPVCGVIFRLNFRQVMMLSIYYSEPVSVYRRYSVFQEKFHHQIIVRENPNRYVSPHNEPINSILYGFKIYCIKYHI